MEKISESTQILEENATGAPVKDVLWNAQTLQTDSISMIDPGIGKEVILRHFFFKSIPIPKGVPHPTKLELISHYKRLIEITLWSDGLVVREDKPIELHSRESAKKSSKTLYRKMLQENSDFVILILATPRAGVSVREKAKRL